METAAKIKIKQDNIHRGQKKNPHITNKTPIKIKQPLSLLGLIGCPQDKHFSENLLTPVPQEGQSIIGVEFPSVD